MKRKNEELKKKDEASVWEINRELLQDYIETHIETLKNENDWNSELDEKQMKYYFSDIITRIGVMIEIFHGRQGIDHFFRILDNLKCMTLDNGIEIQNVDLNRR